MARSILFVAVTMAVLIAVPARANENKAREILDSAKQAVSSLHSLSYDASYLGDGALAKSLPIIDGKVLIAKSKQATSPRLRIEGFKTTPRARDATPFCYSTDGSNAAMMDGARRTHFVGPDAAARSQEERIRLFPTYYVAPDAFDAELKAPILEYQGTAEAGGVDCHVIEVAYDAARRQTATLFIGATDHILRRAVLPRGNMAMRIKSATPASNSAEIFTARNVVLNPPVNESSFRQPTPKGYRVQNFVNPAQRNSGGMLAAGTEAPDWTLPDESGENVSLKSLRGQVVVVDFWASWCGPCKMAMPHLQSLHDKYKDKPVKVFSVNCRERGGQDAAARNYLKQKKFTYPQLFKGDSAANDYLVRGIPTMYVIGADGKILHGERGFKPDLVRSMSAIIDADLKKTASNQKTDGDTTKTVKAG